MIRCRSYFNTELIRIFCSGNNLVLLEIIDRFLDDDAISVRLDIESICNHKKVLIRHYNESLKFLQDKEIIFNWKWLIGDDCPHLIIPDNIYLVNPKYIRHINRTQFKKYLKRTANKIADTSRRHIVDKYWAANLIPVYGGDEYGGFYVKGYEITTEYNPDTINRPIFSI